MLKSLHLLAVILPLFVPCPLRAEVTIAASCRVKNRPPGRCGWCVVETLARHLGLQAMYGLTEKHPSLCSPYSLEKCLQNAEIAYRIQYPGHRDEDILRYAIRANLGAAVGFRQPWPGADKHIVTLIDFQDDAVKVIDPNDAGGRTRHMSLEHFRRWWDGFALVLEPGADWAKNSGGGDQLDAANRRRVYGSFSPPREPFCPPQLRFQAALYSSFPKMERNGSVPELIYSPPERSMAWKRCRSSRTGSANWSAMATPSYRASSRMRPSRP